MHNMALAQPQVWQIIRRDVSEFTEDDGDIETVSTHSSLQAANDRARLLMKEEARALDQLVLEEYMSEDGCYLASLTDEHEAYDDFPEVHIEVCPEGVEGDDEDFVLETRAIRPLAPTYGPMVTIPRGNPLLRGAGFLFLGSLETMNIVEAETATALYGGHSTDYYHQADYAVIGRNANLEALGHVHEMGIEPISEQTFYSLLQSGVPAQKRLHAEREHIWPHDVRYMPRA